MAKRIEYKILESFYSGEDSNAPYIGGPVTTQEASSILPSSITIPAKGDGDKWIYRKYWLHITNVNFSEAPSLSNVQVTGLGASGAHITWDTDKNGDSYVSWGTTSQNYGFTSGDDVQATTHDVPLAFLEDGTTYYYQCTSTDSQNQQGTSQEFTFATLDETAPVIESVVIDLVPNAAPRVVTTTDEGTTGTVSYGQTGADGVFGYGYATGRYTEFDTVHTLIFDETQSGNWFFQVEMEDTSSNATVTGELALFIPSTGEDGEVDGPVISEVTVPSTGHFTVRVDWVTDRLCQTKIVWGTGVDSYFGQQTDPTFNTIHSIDAVGLADSTLHYYRPVAIDQAALVTTGDEGAFTTTDGTSPGITGLQISTTDTLANLSWQTTENASGEFFYGTAPDVFDNPDGNFTLVVDGQYGTHFRANSLALTPDTTYYGQIIAIDQNTNSGEYKNWTFITDESVDLDPPIISNLIATPIPSGGKFTWQTDETAFSHIEYSSISGLSGTNTGEYQTSKTNHELSVSGLSGDTTYFYELTVWDAANNTGNTEWLEWDVPPPEAEEEMEISNVRAVNIADTTATIVWETNLAGNSIVRYGISDVSENLASNSSPVTTHVIGLDSLTPSTTYIYTVSTVEVGVGDPKSATSDQFDFTTEAAGGSSSLNDGDELGTLEFRVPSGTFPNDQIPVHGSVVLTEEDDLNINWKITGPGNTDTVCQRELIKRKANGTWILAEIVALINIPPTAQPGDVLVYTLLATNQALPANFTPPNLGPMDVELFMPAPSDIQLGEVHDLADIFTETASNTRVFKDGHVCQTKRIYNRVTDPQGDDTLGVAAYVTYYNNYPITLIRLRFDNCHIDPSGTSGGGGVHGNDYDVTGIIYFDLLRTTRSTDGINKLVNRSHRYCTGQGASSNGRINLIRYAGANDQSRRSVQGIRSEIWPPGFTRNEHIAWVEDEVYEVAAQQMLEYQNHVFLTDGRNDGRDTRYFGPCLYRKAKITNDYVVDGLDASSEGGTNQGGNTFAGRDGEHYRRKLAGEISRYNWKNNTYEGESMVGLEHQGATVELGCWHPWVLGNKGTEGGIYYLGHAEQQDMTPGTLMSYSYYVDVLADRGNDYFMLDGNGNVLGAKDWKDNNGGVLPFSVIYTTSSSARRIPVFYASNYPHSIKNIADITNVYNGGTCDYLLSTSTGGDVYDHWDNYTVIGDSHLQRKFRCFQGLINEFNCPFYRDQFRAMVEFSLLSNDRDTSYGDLFGESSELTLKDYQNMLGTDSSTWYKGLDTKERQFGRGKAWSHYIIAMYYTYALDQVGTHGSKVHSSDVYISDGTSWRSEVYNHALTFHDVHTKAVPGGMGLTSPAHYRMFQSSYFGSSAYNSNNNDVGGVLFGVDGIGTAFSSSLLGNSTHQLWGLTSNPLGSVSKSLLCDIGWYEDFNGVDGEITVEANSQWQSFQDGETCVIIEKVSSDDQVPPPDENTPVFGSFTLVASGPTVKFAQQYPSWTYPLSMWQNFSYAQIMEMNFVCLSWFAFGTAFFDGVDNTKRDDLYSYVYDYAKAQLNASDHLMIKTSDAVPDQLAGYTSGLRAISTHGVEDEYEFSTRIDPFIYWQDFPSEHPWERELKPDPVEFHTFAPQVCALYAAEALGIKVADFALTDEMVVEPLKFGYSNDLFATKDWDLMIKRSMENSGKGRLNAWVITDHINPWLGEVQWRRAQLGFSSGPFSGSKVKKVRIGLRQKFGSGKILLASTPETQSIIEAEFGTTLGNQSPVVFYEGTNVKDNSDGSQTGDDGGVGDVTTGNTIGRPEFVIPEGEDQFLTLYGNDGKKGGEILVDQANTYAVPFWVALRLEENEPATDIIIDFGVNGEEG